MDDKLKTGTFDRIMELMDAYGKESARRLRLLMDPERMIHLEEWRVRYNTALKFAALDLRRVSEGPNRYCGDDCCPHLPAVSVVTQFGTFELWWRKRVMVLDWSGTDVHQTADELFPGTDDTKGNRSIHCWTYEKLNERLSAVSSQAARDSVPTAKEAS